MSINELAQNRIRVGCAEVFNVSFVENRLKLTQSFHLKLTHPVTA
jgi:hypothetical protein